MSDIKQRIEDFKDETKDCNLDQWCVAFLGFAVTEFQFDKTGSDKSWVTKILKDKIDLAIAEERKRWVEIMGNINPPKEWKECLKSFDGKNDICTLCGFNPELFKKYIINLITNTKK